MRCIDAVYSNGIEHRDIQILTMTMCDAHQRFISPPSSFKALVAMNASRAARMTALIDAGMIVYVGLKAQPPTQPSSNKLQKTFVKFVKDVEDSQIFAPMT